MKYFEDFQSSGESFEDRDHPSSLLSALGRLALAYSELEQRVETTIGILRDSATSGPPASLDDLSFDRKLDLLGDLIATAERRVRFNAGDVDASEYRRELIQFLKEVSKRYKRSIDPSLTWRSRVRESLRQRVGPEWVPVRNDPSGGPCLRAAGSLRTVTFGPLFGRRSGSSSARGVGGSGPTRRCG